MINITDENIYDANQYFYPRNHELIDQHGQNSFQFSFLSAIQWASHLVTFLLPSAHDFHHDESGLNYQLYN